MFYLTVLGVFVSNKNTTVTTYGFPPRRWEAGRRFGGWPEDVGEHAVLRCYTKQIDGMGRADMA